MPSRLLDAEIDRLYQLPLDEFTAARNALAKQAAGADAARVRALGKPPVPAWIVNQLYWRDRRTWDALISAAENARKVNRAVIGGKSGDVRAANAVHDDAIDAAFKAALALLATSGHPATDATRQAVATTLRALPGDETPGRLTRPVQAIGFGALAGVTVAARPRRPEPPKTREPAEDAKGARERTLQKQAEAAAARELKDAETAVRREEFERARLVREAARTEATLEKAREAMERAKADLDRAEREAREAAAANRAAAERARKAQEALARLKKTVDS
jgi:hypothetical protein